MKPPALLIFLLSACAAPTPTPFYDQPPRADAGPGALIAAEPFPTGVPGAVSYRILYNSEDESGHIIAVSGLVYIPRAAPPPGGRNLVAWAHPTTGIARGCALSLEGSRLTSTIPGLADFIAAGDVVAATDYQGLGAPGVHPYLIGKASGADILDSARAAASLPGAKLSGRFVVWGHSQGADAALFAGQMAASYAPELHLLGVAAAAPPTDMRGELTEPFRDDTGRLLAAYVYYSWSATYHVPITTIVYPAAVPHVNKVASKCIEPVGQALQAIIAAHGLNPTFRSHPPQFTDPWVGLFERNSPGQAPAGAPLLIVQGLADPTVEPYWTERFVGIACRRHDVVAFRPLPGVAHLEVAQKSLPIVEAWIAARFADQPAPDNCAATLTPPLTSVAAPAGGRSASSS
jgi:fermentation-respiration switch protein FrsA (DUF1100 family)